LVVFYLQVPITSDKFWIVCGSINDEVLVAIQA